MRAELLVAAIGPILFISACESADDPAAEACEHLKEAATTLMAGSEASAAPAVNAGHTHYDLMLNAKDGSRAGMVSFTSIKQQYLNVFLDQDIPLVVSSGTSNLSAAKSEKSGPCAEVKASYVFALAAKSYQLAFGPAQAERVGLILIADEHIH